jgi:uncharacterized damage-inducible protein DinB
MDLLLFGGSNLRDNSVRLIQAWRTASRLGVGHQFAWRCQLRVHCRRFALRPREFQQSVPELLDPERLAGDIDDKVVSQFGRSRCPPTSFRPTGRSPITTPGRTIVCWLPAKTCLRSSSKRRARASSSLQKTLNHILIIDQFYVDALEGGWLGPRAWENPVPCTTVADLRLKQPAVDQRLIRVCEGLTADSLDESVRINRDTRVQTERRDRLLMHLFQHQIHHRGQAHTMLAGTAITPPQLDEFFSIDEAPLRATEFRELGWTEQTVWKPRT